MNNPKFESLSPISERIREHLTAQRARSLAPTSYDVGLRCAYRGDGGLSCAVGCLIDDKHYSDALEGLSAGDPEVLAAVSSSLGMPEPSRFAPAALLATLLMLWQRYHDTGLYGRWASGEIKFSPADFHDYALRGVWPSADEVRRYE